MCSRSGGITTRQFERDLAAISPDPCQGTSSTCEFSYWPERVAGRKRFSPGLTRISDFRRAWRNTSGRGDIPERASIRGRAKSSKVTMVETGLPGRPKKYLCRTGAKTSRAGAPAPHEQLLFVPATWAATIAAQFTHLKDPQIVVVDEVLGQWIALAGARTLNWKSYLAAFALFRLFDIWKPPPVRQLEALPGGLGINLDDVMAGVYAALVLFLAGCFNLY